MDDIPKRPQRIYGNQHASRYGALKRMLHLSHTWLQEGDVPLARSYLNLYRNGYEQAPASTRRRWKCGK